MTSATHRPPTVRALRAAIADALNVPQWSVFHCARAVPDLTSHPPQRAAALILLAVLAHALRGESNDPGPLLQRVQGAASWRVRAQQGGPLPEPFAFLRMMPLAAALEMLIEQARGVALRRHIQDPHTNRIQFNAIELGLSAQRATLSVRTVSGIEWHGVFFSPVVPLVNDKRVSLAVTLNAPAIIELSRLVAGDESVEHRIAYFAGPRSMEGEPIASHPSPPTPQRRSRRRPASQIDNPNWQPDQ